MDGNMCYIPIGAALRITGDIGLECANRTKIGIGLVKR
jgi:hypothetical protein